VGEKVVMNPTVPSGQGFPLPMRLLKCCGVAPNGHRSLVPSFSPSPYEMVRIAVTCPKCNQSAVAFGYVPAEVEDRIVKLWNKGKTKKEAPDEAQSVEG
jgi:hypothetical protein